MLNKLAEIKFRRNKTVISMVKYFFDTNKPAAAVCHGEQLLAAAGVLEGRKCAAHPAWLAQFYVLLES